MGVEDGCWRLGFSAQWSGGEWGITVGGRSPRQQHHCRGRFTRPPSTLHHHPPPVRPLHPGHCQSSDSEWIQPAGLRLPPSFSFQCVGRTNIKQFHFQSRPPPRPPLYPKLTPPHPPRVHAHHNMGGRLTHLIVGAQLRNTICLLGKMGSLLHCVP